MTQSTETTGGTPAHGRNFAPPGAELRSWLGWLENNGLLAVAKPGVKLKFELAMVSQCHTEWLVLMERPERNRISAVMAVC